VEKCDVALQILLGFLEDPPFEVNEVKSMGVFYLLGLEPLDEKRKVIRNFFPVENSIDHVAAEQSHLYFISCV